MGGISPIYVTKPPFGGDFGWGPCKLPRNHALLYIQNARKTFTSIKALNIFDIMLKCLLSQSRKWKMTRILWLKLKAQIVIIIHIPFLGQRSLPKTNSSPLKIDHPKRRRSYSNHPFSGVNSLLVSGRVSPASNRYRYLHAASLGASKYHISAAQLGCKRMATSLERMDFWQVKPEKKKQLKLEQHLFLQVQIQQTCLESEWIQWARCLSTVKGAIFWCTQSWYDLKMIQI